MLKIIKKQLNRNLANLRFSFICKLKENFEFAFLLKKSNKNGIISYESEEIWKIFYKKQSLFLINII